MAKAEKQAADRAAVDAAIAAMDGTDRPIGECLHAIITENAPMLWPRTWYGMPAYATEQGKIVCFFRDRKKFGERYLTLGFNDSAHLDDGNLWPIVYAVTGVSAEDEARIATLVTLAVSQL